MAEPLSVITLAKILASRATGKKADSFLVFIGIEGPTASLVKKFREEVNTKLVEIDATLSRLEDKMDAVMLRPLKAGFIKLKETKDLPESLQRSSLQQALSDFNDMIATPYGQDIGHMSMAIAKSMAYFGKAAVLNAFDASDEIILDAAHKGFLHHSGIAKSFMTDEAWKQLTQAVFKSKALVTFELIADPKVFDREHSIIFNYRLGSDKNEIEESRYVPNRPYLGGEPLFGDHKTRKKGIPENIRKWTIPLEGESRNHARFDAKVKWHQVREGGGTFGTIDRSRTVTTESELFFVTQSGMHHHLVASLLKVKTGWFTYAFELSVDFKEISPRAIDLSNQNIIDLMED